jgi:hypothetical protein
MIGPELTSPSKVQIAYKKEYGYYPYANAYANGFVQRFAEGFNAALAMIDEEVENYPDY